MLNEMSEEESVRIALQKGHEEMRKEFLSKDLKNKSSINVSLFRKYWCKVLYLCTSIWYCRFIYFNILQPILSVFTIMVEHVKHLLFINAR